MTAQDEPLVESDRIIATVPSAVADELIAAGVAFAVPRVRAGELTDVDILIALTQTAATVIPLIQAPATIDQLIGLLTRQTADDARKGGRIIIKAKGSRGRVELKLDADTSATEIARVLRMLA